MPSELPASEVHVGAGDDVWGEQSPRHRLGDTGLEPDRHWEQAVKLSEDHLLTGLGSDGLEQELGRCSRVEVLQESIDSRFTPSSELLTKVDKAFDVSEWVLVLTWLGRVDTEHVSDEGGVSDFLVGHELDEESVTSIETGGFEVLDREGSESVVEEIQFDQLLVKSERQGLVVKVRQWVVERV